MEDKLGLFNGEKSPDIESAWKLYGEALSYNAAVNLNETVRVNENFYIGK